MTDGPSKTTSFDNREGYRAMVERTVDGMVVVDDSGVVLFANPASAAFLGRTSDELLGYQLGYPAVSGEPVELRIPRGGQMLVLEIRSSKIVWDGQNAHLASLRDVTRRQELEDKSNRKHKMLAQVLDSIPQSVFWKDRDSVYLGCNKVFARNAGFASPDEIVGKNDFDLPWSHKEAEAYRAADRDVMEQDKSKVHIVETQQRTDGSRAWVDTTKVPLKDDEGRVYGVLGVYEDITESKKARETLTRLGMAVDQAGEAVVITDTEGNIEYANPAFGLITGYSVEESVGRNMRILKSGLQDKMFYENLWGTILGGNVWKGRFQNRKKDGTLYEEEAIISPVRDRHGEIVGFVGVKRDTTREVLLQKQMQTAQRMESVGLLAGGIAHDFNNALTGIFGFGELLQSQVAGNEDALSCLSEIFRSADRAATLTRQLLTYSRRQIIEPINMSLNAAIVDLVKLISKVVGENIEIRTFLGENLPVIRADVGQIEQVVMNLILNSRDAMPNGGQVTIETGLMNLDDGYVRYHPYMIVGSYVILTVSDTGVGMDAKTQERVFDPFFTTKTPDKGTGLGLSMVYGIVKQHKGFIHLYSEPGKGTTFKVYLPPSEGAPDEIKPVKTSEILGGTETILLGEDDETIRKLVARTLRDNGYTVLATRNGNEATKIFRQNHEKISLVLLDVVMPLKGGKEAYELMREIKPGLKVVFMSGYRFDSGDESFVPPVGLPFLAKPFGPGSLVRKVRSVLDG
ncbi:MAG: PAS domain S-box protein [Candidatus Deferrimicrobiaceae bacterium]